MRALLSDFWITLQKTDLDNVSQWYVESQGTLLIQWLPMTSIIFVIVRTCSNQFRWNYLKNKRNLPNFLVHLWNLYQILNILKRTMILIAYVFPELQTAKYLVTPMSKKPRFRTPFDSQHVKGLKQLWNLGDSTFIKFHYHYEITWLGKCLS